MTSLFDGMGPVLTGALGAAVTIHPGGGAGVEIRAVVRDQDVEVADDDGEPVILPATVLKATRGDVAGLLPDDRVIAAGVTYEVRYRIPARSPAADRLETFVLREVP